MDHPAETTRVPVDVMADPVMAGPAGTTELPDGMWRRIMLIRSAASVVCFGGMW